jgi:SAM-dependent methyltransferase
MKTASRACPVCSSSEVEVLYTQRFATPALSPLPAISDVVACPACGLVYADTPVAQEGYDRYYAKFSKYEDPTVATGGGASPFDHLRLEDVADELSSRVGAEARVLDIGCAGGGLLAALHRRGFTHLHGVDAATACVARVRSMGFPATCLPFSGLASLRNEGPFELVVLSHVLEHVVDLLPLVTAAKSLIASGGLLYIETPDASRYGEYDHVPFYFFDGEHINHFDTSRLAALGEAVGLVTASAGARTFEVAPGKTYPACWVLMGQGPSDGARRTSGEVASLRDRVADYVRRCRLSRRFPELERLAAAGTPVVVWGAGSFAQRLFGDGLMSGCRVVGIVDRDGNKQGRPFAGFTVEVPEVALRRHPGAAVVVAAAIQESAIAMEARTLMRGGEVVTLTAPRSPDSGVASS